ncbi:MAG: fibronectin type III domain-containing protein [Kofleriaceae bacterium]
MLLVPWVSSATARADATSCVDVQFTPTDQLQIVAWVETASGQYVDTLYITQQTGSFGLGNRPGRFDFNSGPNWPYGRRITTFPVWSHHHGLQFPTVLFQSATDPDPDYCFAQTGTAYTLCSENDLSHDFSQSSRELHYCRPLNYYDSNDRPMWDAGTCATTAYSDKGKFSTTATTGYPPRIDVIRQGQDSPSVDMYKALDPFDAISAPTPIGGSATHAPWAAAMTAGDYVLFVETAKEFDTNAAYDSTTYPAPSNIVFADFGLPYRGQPSIVYRVPFTVGSTSTEAATATYFGYGSPDGTDGDIRPADGTITTDTPGSGAARLELVSDGTDMYRVRVTIDPNQGGTPPLAPSAFAATTVHAGDVELSFVAPGVGPQLAQVSGYEIRIRASDEMTAANFADSMPVTAHVDPAAAGMVQTFELDGLLPETDYWIGVRAFDDCHNAGDLAITHVVTATRTSGSVDACFVATAAYGSLLANDVEMLRRTRDLFLRTNALGELGVEAYYTFGPLLAAPVGESELLRATAREVLAPIVARVRRLVY